MAPARLLFIACLVCNISIVIIQLQKAAATSFNSMAKPGCKEKCGDTVIPYPFGIKKGCYLDETFEVTCNESTRSLYLTVLSLTVDLLSVSDHTLRAYLTVLAVPFNKSSGEGLDSIVMTWSFGHFTFSLTRNKFVAVGCDFYAYFADGDTENLLGGCATFCNHSGIKVSSQSTSCSGLGCCQINLPHSLKSANFWVQTINTEAKSWADHCGFFTFVDKNYPYLNKSSFTDCNKTYLIPAIYEWAVGNTSCNIAEEREDYVCGQNSHCINNTISNGYHCSCDKGYVGNPYLENGCRDVDECSNPKDNNCLHENQCVNMPGSYLCLQPKRKHLSAVLIPLGTGFSFLLLVAITLWMWRKLKKMNDRKLKQKFFKRNGGLLLKQRMSSTHATAILESKLFTIEELDKATDKFSESRVLGKGGLGTVYKGMLSDGSIVAVKISNKVDESQVGQFINEVFILSQINHRHIIKLLGCCLEAEVPLLVYEYVSNGTLNYHLHEEPNISWDNRLRIAAEVAGALAYLHSCASTPIFHRDIKSSNILLDGNYRAVVSDFGLSRAVSIDKTHLTTLVGGTFGYLDPEYFRSGQLNDKSDVYAFGVVLAELLTGQKPVSSVKGDEGLALRFRMAIKENCLFKILDQMVIDEGQEEEVFEVAKLAKRCLKIRARKRPSMREVTLELDQLRQRKKQMKHEGSSLHQCSSMSDSHCGHIIDDSETENDDETMSQTEDY